MVDSHTSHHVSLSACSHCGKCVQRCEILDGPQINIGHVAEAYKRIMTLPPEQQNDAVLALVNAQPDLYNTLRTCCFCGHCTAACHAHIPSAHIMRAWRELFSRAGLMPEQDSKLVMVDNEWHIFSAYRAIYGIAYPDVITLQQAAELGPGAADTLFFPGCSLVSYAPEVIVATGKWLSEAGITWALSAECCGSPLMSAGLFDRADALRKTLMQQIQQAGITRILTVCPGCSEELAASLPEGVQVVPLPELLLQVSQERLAKGEQTGFHPLTLSSVTVFDSCHDREDQRNATALRALFDLCLPSIDVVEMLHSGKDALCCGAGGAVSSYDGALSDKRVWRVIDEAKDTKAEAVVTMCPTCSYTMSQACLAHPEKGIEVLHYLEVLLGLRIDWAHVFNQLEGMWSGQYGPWLAETFFGS